MLRIILFNHYLPVIVCQNIFSYRHFVMHTRRKNFFGDSFILKKSTYSLKVTILGVWHVLKSADDWLNSQVDPLMSSSTMCAALAPVQY